MLTHDLRQSVRRLSRAPGLMAVATALLALSTSANSALFVALDALFFRPIAAASPDQLVVFSGVDRAGQRGAIPLATFSELAQQHKGVQILAGYSGGGRITTVVDDSPSESWVDAVTEDYFEVLGIRPALGRLDYRTGGSMAAVVGFRFWRDRLGGDPDAIGRTVQIESETFTVAGVAADGFLGLDSDHPMDITILLSSLPLVLRLPQDWPVPVAHVIGRLDRVSTIEVAAERLQAVLPSVLAQTVPPSYSSLQRQELLERRLEGRALTYGLSVGREQYRRPLTLLLACAICVLIVACINLSGVLVARSAERRFEVAVRAALGATPRHFARQLVSDSIVLSVAGVAVGVPLAWMIAGGIVAFIGASGGGVPLDLSVNWRVLAAVAGVGAGVVLLLATTLLLAAAAQGQLRPVFNSRTATASTSRVGEALLVAQVAFSIVILVATVSLAIHLDDLRDRDLGMQIDGVVVMSLRPQPGGYASLNDAEYYPRLVDALSRLPGVRQVSLSNPGVLLGDDASRLHAVTSASGGGRELHAQLFAVSPDFFSSLGIPLLAGRRFGWEDDAAAPAVAIISRSVADQLFGAIDVSGRVVAVGTEPRRQRLQIIGVVADSRLSSVHASRPAVFVSWLQEPPPYARWPSVQLTMANRIAAPGEEIRKTVQALRHEYVGTMSELPTRLGASMVRDRALANLSLVFAAFALAMVLIGLYAVLSSAVTKRAREIGIRLSFGATPVGIAGSIARRAAAIVLIGCVAGLVLVRPMVTMLEAALPGVQPAWATSLTVAAGVLLITGLIAAWLPARKASSIDPVVLLRQE